MDDFKYQFSKLLMISDGYFVLNLNPYCQGFAIKCTFRQMLRFCFKIYTCKLGVPPNIDLLCGPVINFLGGLLQYNFNGSNRLGTMKNSSSQ